MKSIYNSFPLSLKVVNFVITNYCNARCRMCANDSDNDPKKTEEIDPQILNKFLSEKPKTLYIEGINISGGEPFYNFLLLSQIVKLSNEYVDNVIVLSNCFWAKNTIAAKNKLNLLKSSGLTRLTISSDFYHSEFVPFSFVDNAIIAANELNIRCNLNCVQRYGKKDLDNVCRSLQYSSLLDHKDSFPCTPIGRGKNENAFQIQNLPKSRCKLILSSLAIKPNGNVYACCGVGGFTDPLCLGNASSININDAFQSALSDPMIIALAIHGPAYFLSLDTRLQKLENEKFTGICHLCNTILNDHFYSKIVKDNIDSQRSNLLAIYDTISDFGKVLR